MSKQDSFPVWSEHIKALRRDLGLSQFEFGKKLNTTAMSVSRWERGAVPPSAASYLGLGKLAGARRGWSFWNLAGITKQDMRTMNGGELPRPYGGSLLKVITALENQARLNERHTTRLRAFIRYLPTPGLQREYRAMSKASSDGVKVMRKQIVALKHVAA